MKRILAYVKILDGNDKPSPNITVNLEIYIMSSKRWLRIGAGKTDAQGSGSINAATNAPNEVYAPMLRLTIAGTPAPKVLGQHALLQYDSTTQVLTADFGVIEILENETYKLTASNALFNRTMHYVAGQPNQPIQIKAVAATRLNAFVVNTNPTLAKTVNLPVADDGELKRLKTVEVDLKSTLSAKDQLLTSRDAELKLVKKSENDLKSAVASKETLLNTKTLELTTANKRISELAAQLVDKDKIIKETKTNPTIASTPVVKGFTPINKLAENIGTEVFAANKVLSSNINMPYRFGRINLNIKGAAGDDGKSIALSDVENGNKGGAISEVNFELLPTNEQANTADKVIVPDVIGLTEGVVRRILHSLGLKLEVINKSMNDDSTPIGQSMQQSPKAGSQSNRNSTVLVVFAAP